MLAYAYLPLRENSYRTTKCGRVLSFTGMSREGNDLLIGYGPQGGPDYVSAPGGVHRTSLDNQRTHLQQVAEKLTRRVHDPAKQNRVEQERAKREARGGYVLANSEEGALHQLERALANLESILQM